MAKSILSAKVMQSEAAAIAWVESRVWPQGPVCPHCGGVDRIGKMGGKATRIGLWKCYQCRKQFTVKVGTVFEDSHVPMNLWLQAMYLLCSSKKGISSNQLSRTLGVTLKTAWFISHRIREAMRVTDLDPMGGSGKVVEVDETYIGRLDGIPKQRSGGAHKNVVLTLVERGGSSRSFHVDSTSIADIAPILKANIAKESGLMTDEGRHYMEPGGDFASHEAVNHGEKEYVRYWNEVTGEKRPDGKPHVETATNTVEGFYSIFKRGMHEGHLPALQRKTSAPISFGVRFPL